MAKGGGKTKNLRYGDYGGDNNIEDLFDDDISSAIDDGSVEPLFEIDTEFIDKESDTLAAGIISNVAKVYASETFLKDHPDFRKRLDSELQSLKMHYKMRAIDDQIQNEIVKAIARKPDNASLYVALTKLQAQLTTTQNKIDATMDRIQTLLKSYQTEMDFGENDEMEEYNTESGDGEVDSNGQFSMHIIPSTTTRGTKDFINQFKSLNYSDIENELKQHEN